MFIIILAIKTFFFFGTDSYSLEKKPHMSHFFLSFYEKMIRVLCIIITVPIKDLEFRLINLNLLLRKITIWFRLLAQKIETNN